MTKTSLTRRILPLLAASMLGLTACGSSSVVTSSSDAFTVNGKGYSKDDLNAVVDVLVEAGQITKQNGSVSKTDMTPVLQVMVKYQSYLQFIEKYNLKETAANRAKVVEQASADENFPTYPKPLQDLLVNLNLAALTTAAMKTPSSADLEKLYNKAPASAGVLCMSHILVKTKAQADAVLKELDGGAKFADVAKAKSIEPAAKTSGGALANGEEPCSALASLQESFDGDFMVGAVAAKPGVPSGPVKSSFGWHIILSHPFSEVKGSIANVLATNAGDALLAGYMATSDISVNSTYGTWVGATAKIS